MIKPSTDIIVPSLFDALPDLPPVNAVCKPRGNLAQRFQPSVAFYEWPLTNVLTKNRQYRALKEPWFRSRIEIIEQQVASIR
jgi:hypothetical protein